MCFVWISEQTAVISLHGINLILPKQIVFTARYSLYLYVYFRLIFIFKWIRPALEYILPCVTVEKGCFELEVGKRVFPKRVDLRIILK